MTRNEAYNLLKTLPFSEVFLYYFGYKTSDDRTDYGVTIEKVKDNFNFDELIAYFVSLDLPYQFVYDFINGDIEFADLENNYLDDAYDYLELYKNKDGSLDLATWTETAGNTYKLSNYGKTWKEYVPSAEELAERERSRKESAEHMHKIISECFDRIMPNIVANPNAEQKAECGKFTLSGLATYKRSTKND